MLDSVIKKIINSKKKIIILIIVILFILINLTILFSNEDVFLYFNF